MGVEEDPPISGWLTTGCTLLDLGIAGRLPGGIPMGRITRMYGGHSTCKSILSTIILGAMQRKGGEAYYVDIEGTFDSRLARRLGLNPDDTKTFKYVDTDVYVKNTKKSQCFTVEDFFDKFIPQVLKSKSKRPKLIVVDTLTSLPSISEMDKDLDKTGFGTVRAKRIGAGLRKYHQQLTNKNITLLLVDQTRDSLSMWGPKENVGGGRGPKFYASAFVYLRLEGKVTNKDKVSLGIWTKFDIEKNKVSSPHRFGSFRLLFDYGLDDIVSNLRFLKSKQTKNKTDVRDVKFKFEACGYEGTERSLAKMIEKKNMEKGLQREVMKVWREMHASEDRKERKWM